MNQEITKQIVISSQVFSKIKKEIENLSDFKKEIEKVLKENITNILEVLIGGAIIINASDFHFEPQKEKTKLRVRLDGVLHEISAISNEDYEKFLSRLKLLSGIKLNVTDRPQDGRFSVLLEENPVEIRTSTLPSEYGESVVLRVLNPKSLVNIKDLGLREELYNLFKSEINKPNGMIIVTGPTGSGKTTTLYAFLKAIQSPEVKIITIEDPIEYHLEGISQTQVVPEKEYSFTQGSTPIVPQKRYDFASGLKAIMRQDPDVILVGEIRDLETADTAIQAALTGHLVLSTLHTNDAAGTIPRLIALGAKPVNIAPALNLAIAQRLIRKVCKKCSQLKPASPEELNKLKEGLKRIKIKNLPKIVEGLKIPKVKGCKDCNFTGYKGRIGIFEAFSIDSELEKFILTSPSISALKEKAIEKGMTTMYQDGLIKIVKGISTIEEVERVVVD